MSQARAILEASLYMERCGHSPGTSGNVSVRTPDGMLITPSGVAPADTREGDLVAMPVDEDVDLAALLARPSSEWPMHAALYRARPEVGAVVHSHSRFATILACVRVPIPALHYMVAGTGGFEIPLAPYATFGTRELSDHILETLGGGNACLLANHGQVAVGRSLAEAIRTAELVERLAETYWGTLAIGGPVVLDAGQMKDVVQRFAAGYGQDSRKAARPSPDTPNPSQRPGPDPGGADPGDDA